MGDLQTQIASLEAKYDLLRQEMIAGKIERVGDEYTAKVSVSDVRSCNYKVLTKLLSVDQFNEVVSVKPVHKVTLKPKSSSTTVKPTRSK